MNTPPPPDALTPSLSPFIGRSEPEAVCPSSGTVRARAFSILEVVIACTLFCMLAFAVLGVVVRCLGAARKLQKREPDAAMLLSVYAQTNILAEELVEGDFEDLYPEMYPDYSWIRETKECEINGSILTNLAQVNVAVIHRSGKGGKGGASETHMTVLLFPPRGLVKQSGLGP
jgi:hypothetical protein